LATEAKTLPTMPDWVPTLPMVIGPALLGTGADPLGAGAEPPPGAGVGAPALPPALWGLAAAGAGVDSVAALPVLAAAEP